MPLWGVDFAASSSQFVFFMASSTKNSLSSLMFPSQLPGIQQVRQRQPVAGFSAVSSAVVTLSQLAIHNVSGDALAQAI